MLILPFELEAVERDENVSVEKQLSRSAENRGQKVLLMNLRDEKGRRETRDERR